jgi:hypothetical protein
MLTLAFSFCQASNRDFSLRSIVSGNWSTSSNGQFRVLYFVPVHGKGHFQALLNDKFLDVFVTSLTSARVTYQQYNFTVNIENPLDDHPSAFSRVTESIFIDICLLSKSALDISIIDTSEGRISSWSVIRPHLKNVGKGDLFNAVVSLIGIAFFARKTLGYCRGR